MEHKLLKILKLEGSEIATAFKKASVKGTGTPQEVADFREMHFNKFISKYFPFPHRVCKSQIIDSYGNESNSIDCVVLNPNHPYIVDIDGKFNVVLADGTDVAIEIKPDISDKTELHRGLKQISTVKKLDRREGHVFSNDPKLIELARKIPTFIFTLKVKSVPQDTMKEIVQYYEDNCIPEAEQVDFVIINEVGIISHYKHPATSILLNDKIGYFYEEWKELTLASFVMKLYSVFHATPTLTKPILKYYLSNYKPYNMLQYHKNL